MGKVSAGGHKSFDFCDVICDVISVADLFTAWKTLNYSKNAFTLKCDIRKFFDSIDHEILLNLIKRKCRHPFLLNLISKIISSFEISPGKGLPLGNVTSQIFANIYMNELDQFAKHVLKAEYYIRYCDDFVIIDESKDKLESYISQLPIFLHNKLSLHLHPRKISIRKISQGIDFLGYVSLPHYRVLRTRTKRRMFKRISENNMISYFGMLIHCKSLKIRKVLYSMLS